MTFALAVLLDPGPSTFNDWTHIIGFPSYEYVRQVQLTTFRTGPALHNGHAYSWHLVPILSLRKLYVCDVRGSCGRDIGTAFHTVLVFVHSDVMSAIIFADTVWSDVDEESEGHDEIQIVKRSRVAPPARSDARRRQPSSVVFIS